MHQEEMLAEIDLPVKWALCPSSDHSILASSLFKINRSRIETGSTRASCTSLDLLDQMSEEQRDGGAAPSSQASSKQRCESPVQRTIHEQPSMTPPTTPRTCAAPSAQGFSSPRCQSPPPSAVCDFPPTPKAPRPVPDTPLRRAIRNNSAEDVRLALQQSEPFAARTPFFDHDFDTPLCFAARLGCKAEVFVVLLLYGARFDATDVYGYTPLGLWSMNKLRKISDVATAQPQFTAPLFMQMEELMIEQEQADLENSLRVARLFLEYGAKPLSVGSGCVGSDGKHSESCLYLARSAGNDHLVEMYVDGVIEPESE